MQYMLLIYGSGNSWNELTPEQQREMGEEYFRFTEELRASGKMVAGDALQPVSTATSIRGRVLGDLDLAEDAVQDAFVRAAERWPREGVPRNPGAWIVTTARNAAIDRIRREQTLARKTELLARVEELPHDEEAVIPDERLELIFACCHPALAT